MSPLTCKQPMISYLCIYYYFSPHTWLMWPPSSQSVFRLPLSIARWLRSKLVCQFIPSDRVNHIQFHYSTKSRLKLISFLFWYRVSGSSLCHLQNLLIQWLTAWLSDCWVFWFSKQKMSDCLEKLLLIRLSIYWFR